VKDSLEDLKAEDITVLDVQGLKPPLPTRIYTRLRLIQPSRQIHRQQCGDGCSAGRQAAAGCRR